MLILNPDLINSCRVCRSPNQDGDYECLYQQIKHEEAVSQLSEAGKLYENLLDISLDFMDYYPQYLCNSCDLQMKLFKKLKDKAMKTLEYLEKLYKVQFGETRGDKIQDEYKEKESIATNMEQYGVELEMQKMFNEVEETFVEEQEADFIAKELTNPSEEILQTFQENQTFETITTFTKEGVENIEANDKQYNGEQEIHPTFNRDKQPNEKQQEIEEILKTESLDDRVIRQREEIILFTFPEVNNFESLTSLTREEVDSIEASDTKYHREKEMETNFKVVNEPNVEQQEVNRFSEEEEILEDYANSQTEEILQAFQEENNFESLPSLTREEVENMEVSDTQYDGELEKHDIFNNVAEPNVAQQKVNAILKQNILEDDVNRQTEETLPIFQQENNFQNLPSLNLNESQQLSSINYENPFNEDKPLLNDDTATSEFFQIKLDSQDSCSVIDKSDYVTEIYELMEDDSKSIQYSETSEYLLEVEDLVDSKAESSIAYSDIEYIESIYMENNEDDDGNNINEFSTPKKRKKANISPRKIEYQCEACQQEFKTLKEYKKHSSLVHDELYPCNICSKQLKTQKSLTTHMRLHNSEPFQCKICQKTFNQKVHYQYHMNRHNNVRNFKCEECNKAFITKTDLKVHMRFHTGQRSYICDICGKSYLMMEHLKAHSITHTEQKFECELCQQKFATHKTLKQHMNTIHVEEPSFKCNICLKPFRRKHHLDYHSTLHQKGINLLDTHYTLVDETEMINDTEYVRDDFLNHDDDFVDDPGYVALTDENILM